MKGISFLTRSDKPFLSSIYLSYIALLWASVALGDDGSMADQFKWHGFVSQGYVHTDHNDFFGESTSGSFEFYEAGLNTRWQALPNLTVAMQVMSRDAGVFDNGRVRIDYGFVDWSAVNTDTYKMGVRLGRTVNPVGLYNDTRDVAMTRPSIFMPQSIYFDNFRNLVLSSDGGQVYHEWFGDRLSTSFTLAMIRPRLEDPGLESRLLPMNLQGEFSRKSGWLSRFMVDYDFGKVRLGVTAGDFLLEYNGNAFLSPNGSLVLPVDGAEFNYLPLIFSAKYNSERLELTAEYNVNKNRYRNFDTLPILNRTTFGYGYYLQAGYRFMDQWRGYLRYDNSVFDRDDPKGERAASASPDLQPHNLFSRDVTLGLRWDIDKKWMIGAEVHAIEGTNFISNLENSNPADVQKHWTMFSGLISFRF